MLRKHTCSESFEDQGDIVDATGLLCSFMIDMTYFVFDMTCT